VTRKPTQPHPGQAKRLFAEAYDAAAGLSSSLPRALGALANEARVTVDGPRPSPELVPSLPGLSLDRAHRPCHYRAIHSRPDRSPADTYGQRLDGLDLRIPLPSQVRSLPDLALQARGRLVEAVIGLAVPAGRSASRSRRTGARRASATRRSGTPMLT
jgi:hypothetical protein